MAKHRESTTSKHLTTITLRMPSGRDESKAVGAALKVLDPYITGMSIEDEMTILELIEGHPDFPKHIADEAREEAARIHAKALVPA